MGESTSSKPLKRLPIYIVFYSYVHLSFVTLGLMSAIAMYESGPLPENLQLRIIRRAKELKYSIPLSFDHDQFLHLPC
jgi:hypothetical protein